MSNVNGRWADLSTRAPESNVAQAHRSPNLQLLDQRIFLGAALLEAGRGGISRVARMTAASLLAAGCDLKMVSLLDSKPTPMGNSLAKTANGSKLAFAARCHRAALRPGHFIYDSAGIARAHPRFPGLKRPYAVWMHGIEVWHALRPGAKSALLAADLRLVNSRFTLETYTHLHGKPPWAEICWLGTEEDAAPLKPPLFEGAPTVLILARIDNAEGYKGHAELVESWPSVVSAIPNARLLIGGSGPSLAHLKAVARASPVAASIDFTGFVKEADLPALWAQAHVFAMASRKEGFGIVYAEAMRHGLPVIASIHDAGPEINVHEQTGYNVDLDRRGDLADHLIALLRSPELIRRYGQAGHQRWLDHFRQSVFRRRLIPILAKFAGAPA